MNIAHRMHRLANRLRRLGPEEVPPGHFYSVIPSLADVVRRSEEIFSIPSNIPGIELRVERQLDLLRTFQSLQEEIPFYSTQKRIRFDIENDYFSYDDAPILHYMIRRLGPKHIVEIGTGYSSACMLDTSDIYLNSSIDFDFIDIDCGRLRKNLLEKDLKRFRIIEQPIQDVSPEIFAKLEANDLLFIDCSHVMKAGSDLHTILFEILPSLAPGVCIHVHDIRYPFQYPKDWILNKRFWNEAYLLRAFLMYNKAFEITFWLNELINTASPELKEVLRFLPLADWDRRFNNSLGDFSGAGGSIYITKTG